MEIRTFKETDAEQIKNLINHIFKEEYATEQSAFSDEDLKNLSETCQNPRNTILVAIENSKIVGVISMKEETVETALIKRLFVHRVYRGRNYGQVLLRRVIDFSKIKGYKGILFRSTSRMEAAINLCLKNGFEKINEKDLGNIHLVELLLKFKP